MATKTNSGSLIQDLNTTIGTGILTWTIPETIKINSNGLLINDILITNANYKISLNGRTPNTANASASLKVAINYFHDEGESSIDCGTQTLQIPNGGWGQGVTKNFNISYTGKSYVDTSEIFNTSNATKRSVDAQVGTFNFLRVEGTTTGGGSFNNGFLGQSISNSISIYLDVPPTFSYMPMQFDTPFIYAGLTTATVELSDIIAYYGGYITEAKLTIGNNSVVLTGDDTDILSSGTLSILLNAVGTFTPTLTVTDSRGQVKTETLESITVLGYVNPSVSLGIERTDNTGAPADEGTYAVLKAKFTFTDAIATLSEPVVTGGTSVTWYTTRNSAGVVSNPVDWSDTSGISSGDTLYGLVGTFSPNQSYVISVEPKDSKGTGTSVSITLATAFFTIDFLAGGHGIAFGKPAVTDDLFECDLDAKFNKDVSIGRGLTVTEQTSTENLLLQLDTSGASGTVDDDIYADLVTLGWDTDVIV